MTKIMLLYTSLALYALACALPAYSSRRNNYSFRGIACLLVGALSLFYDTAAFIAWLANIPYFIAVFANFSGKPSTWVFTVQIIGCVASLTAVLVDKMMLNESGSEISVNFSSGGLLWLLSMALMLAASFY